MSEERGRDGGGGGLPAAPQRIPGLPANAVFHELKEFLTVNRQASRASIKDEEMAWCHNLAPIAPYYLRTTPDLAAAVFTSLGMIAFDFLVDTSDTGFALIFLGDGSAVQVQLSNGNVVPIAGAHTFSDDIQNAPALIQSGLNSGVVACIISNQAGATDPNNGYFIWDGTNLYRAGSISPVTTITDGGHNYTSVPSVFVFGGSGSGATVVAKVDLGSVSLVTATAPGSGYLPTDSAILIFSGGGQGTSAYGLGITADGVITSLTLVSGGSGFTSVPSIVITPIGGGSGATAVVTGLQGGIITSVQMLTGGSGYSSGATITTSGGGGSGAQFLPVIEDGVVVGVNLINHGVGYDSPPSIHYISTSGSGASGTAVVLNGSVSQVVFNFPSQGGSGYQTPPIVQFVGGGGPASGTISLMPFGVLGTAIETYVGRVWIADGNRVFFTAPESLVDFGNGGGIFQDTDPFQRYTYKRLKQSNGFLYLLSDSSVNYISGVNTGPVAPNATPPDLTPVTVFTNLNIDPQIGVTWHDAVTVFSRQIMFANSKGVYAVTGGAVEKISTQLDRLFYDPPPDISVLDGFLPSMAVTQIFATDILMLLIPVFNPFTQAQQPLFLCSNGRRWWTADQSQAIRWINTFQADSKTAAYGTNGTSFYPLFAQPSSLLQRVLESKLWINPSIAIQKKAWGLYALFECYGTTTLDFTIDTETGSATVAPGTFTGTGTVDTPDIAWGRSAAPEPAGIAIGFTMTSISADFALLCGLLISQDLALLT